MRIAPASSAQRGNEDRDNGEDGDEDGHEFGACGGRDQEGGGRTSTTRNKRWTKDRIKSRKRSKEKGSKEVLSKKTKKSNKNNNNNTAKEACMIKET